jgi:hypothetical protein
VYDIGSGKRGLLHRIASCLLMAPQSSIALRDAVCGGVSLQKQDERCLVTRM